MVGQYEAMSENDAEGRPWGAAVEVELAVAGMHCTACPALVEETLVAQPGVLAATVELQSGRASVTYEPDEVSAEALVQLVSELGYPTQLAG